MMNQSMKSVLIVAAAIGLAYHEASGAPGDLLRTFLNPTPSTFEAFGRSVAAIGGDVLVGDSYDDTGTVNAGGAYLLDGSTGALLRTFPNPTPAETDNFGYSLAAVGGNVLVGAYLGDAAGTDTGEAYLFNASTGALLRTFANPTPQGHDHFGYSVAAFGGNVLVGAMWDDTGATNAGAAYLFNGSTGALLRTFQKPTPVAYDSFGNAVAAVGGNVLVGAFRDDTGGMDSGAAYLFDGATGDLLRTLPNPTPGGDDWFGYSVAAVGGNLLVGAYGDNAGAVNAGAAYLFDGSTGSLLRTFQKPTPAADDFFGYSVTAVGNDVLIGAYGDDAAGADAGAAYLFDGSTGQLLQTFLNPTPADDDYFGCSVAALGINVLVGAYGDDTAAANVGAVYLFEGIPEPGTLFVMSAAYASLLLRRRPGRKPPRNGKCRRP